MGKQKKEKTVLFMQESTSQKLRSGGKKIKKAGGKLKRKIRQSGIK